MSEILNQQLGKKALEVFEKIVTPAFDSLLKEFHRVNGYEAKILADRPMIMGIERCNSIMFRHPDGLEMIICVYWIGGHDNLVAENISMVTLNQSFNIFEITAEKLKKQIRFLAGLGNA